MDKEEKYIVVKEVVASSIQEAAQTGRTEGEIINVYRKETND